MNEVHLMAGINGAEIAMLHCGIKVKPGSGAAAAGEYWRKKQETMVIMTAKREREPYQFARNTIPSWCSQP